jgi:hypothetical protein
MEHFVQFELGRLDTTTLSSCCWQKTNVGIVVTALVTNELMWLVVARHLRSLVSIGSTLPLPLSFWTRFFAKGVSSRVLTNAHTATNRTNARSGAHRPSGG